MVAAIAVGLPLWASFTYRSAVHDLHAELGSVRIDSADVVDARIERCWNGVAPASVRVLVPNGDQTLSEVVSAFLAALGALGFERHGGVVGTVASRPRSDDLDDDVISAVFDDTNGRVVLIADPFDADMVTCLPF
ncbi:MAG: hypothetical protein OEW83_00580 [Acidimicrobiia bacterium]|nr:hypothetical protein [Acidimicrobiia bacterium]